jgi:ligand-binding sensor protein
MMTMASTTDSVILILVCWAGLIGSFTIPMVVKAIVGKDHPQ